MRHEASQHKILVSPLCIGCISRSLTTCTHIPLAILCYLVQINTCYSVHQVSKHWQNQCSQTASTHQTLGSSDQQGDTQSMMQTPLSATSESTIPKFTKKNHEVSTPDLNSLVNSCNFYVTRTRRLQKVFMSLCKLEQLGVDAVCFRHSVNKQQSAAMKRKDNLPLLPENNKIKKTRSDIIS